MAKAGYLVIDPDGTTYVIPARRMGFERLRHLVGGPIDIVGLEPGLDMVINDEGKFTGAWNPVATHIFETFFGSGSDVVFGPVVLSGVDEDRNVPLVPGTLERMRLLATQADQSVSSLPEDPEQLRDLLRELGAKHPQEARQVAEKLRLTEEHELTLGE